MTVFIDGDPATVGALLVPALVNYGAYTSFRMEDRAVRGLDLHLDRLDRSALALFGEAVPRDVLIHRIRQAVETRVHAWVRVGLFAPEITHRRVEWQGLPRVMVSVSEAPPPIAGSMRVQIQAYSRFLPEHKHFGTMELVHARRMARQAGFDDALFMEADGRITEGGLWTAGFLSGDTVVWPDAPRLAGVTQALIDARADQVGLQVETRPVRRHDLAGFDGAFLCNSATPACAILGMDEQVYAHDIDRMERLRRAWALNPPQAV